MKIGFIDYYLDEWHANNYPEFFKTRSGGRYNVCCAYGKIDSPIGGMTNKEWSEKYGVELVDTIEEVIERSDCLIVLSPDNPEMHEELAKLPLASGKPVYIDKAFAPDKATAQRIFKIADENNVKCFSSSALRFSSELDEIDTDKISKIYSEGPGIYDIYAIHQIEPVVRLMGGTPAKYITALGDKKSPSFAIEFEDGRTAQFYHRIDEAGTFRITVTDEDNKAKIYNIESDYFGLFIDAVIKFFDTGVVPVAHENTIDVIAIIEAGRKALSKPFERIEI